MKPNELDSAIGLIKAGRFRKALDELSSLSNRVPQHDQALVNVLEAEVLQETGDTDRAMAIREDDPSLVPHRPCQDPLPGRDRLGPGGSGRSEECPCPTSNAHCHCRSGVTTSNRCAEFASG